MSNAIQERKRCNRLRIPWRNTIPFQELTGDHFGVDLGIISGLGVILGAVQVFQFSPRSVRPFLAYEHIQNSHTLICKTRESSAFDNGES